MDLYPYQVEGVRFLRKHRRAYLADEMGLGKTVQAVVAARESRPTSTLIVCPASVTENWKREWETWGGYGIPTIISYSKLIRRPELWSRRFDLVICDEAHYLKSVTAKRSKVTLALAKKAKAVWLLSGTPMPNDPRELWPVMKILWPEIPQSFGIGNAFEWMDRWCRWSDSDYGYRVWGLKDEARTKLAPRLREVMLRRKLSEIALELPPLRTTVQYLDRDPDLTRKLEDLSLDTDDPEHMSTLRRLLGEYKAPLVARILRDELDNSGQPMVVLYHHRLTGETLVSLLGNNKCGPVFGFDGSTPSLQRQKEIDGFQREGGVFLAQQGAAGTGITLTRASEIVLVEPSWSPAYNEQAIKRIHRIGQEHPCRARLFAVPDSLDAALMVTLARKTVMVKEVVDGR